MTKEEKKGKEYIKQKLTYTDDGRLLDENGYSVMMGWERDIMIESAKTITQRGGDILNIGFGMGIIDTAIQEQNPRSHTIIECHPDVQKKMIEEGWTEKKNVKVIFDKWQNVYKNLPKFDGIYIDTWDEGIREFHRYVHNILKPNGIYSWFNNPRSINRKILDTEYRDLSKNFFMNFIEMDIKYISPPREQTTEEQRFYWHPTWKKYYIPKLTLKSNNKLTRQD